MRENMRGHLNQTIHIIQEHRSIRNFLDRPVEDHIIKEIIKSAQCMPSSINGQQVSVIVIKNEETKQKVCDLSGNQPWIKEAPVLLIFVMDFYKTHLAAQINNTTQIIHESVEGTLVGSFDAGLAMGGAIVAAESLELGVVPIGGIRLNPKEMIELLHLPEYTYPLAALALGYAKNVSRRKPRLPICTFKHMEEYNTKGLKESIEKYDNLMESYLKDIGREQEVNWSVNTSNIYKDVYFPKVYPTMKDQKFLNDK